MAPQISTAGHYFDAGNGSCQAAIVTKTYWAEQPDKVVAVNVVGWNHGGTGFARTSVPLDPAPTKEATANSFHTAEDCPFDH
jgi:hypothetical protein